MIYPESVNASKRYEAISSTKERFSFFAFLIIILSLFENQSLAQYISSERARAIVYALAETSLDLSGLLLESELKTSQRLDITYEGVQNKFLIGYDIDSKIKKGILDHSLNYDPHIDSSSDGYSRILLSVPEREYQRSFYFKGEKAISQISYFTHSWHM